MLSEHVNIKAKRDIAVDYVIESFCKHVQLETMRFH